MLNRLQDCTRRSYLSNFTGIPTDCPHREKNGWTGDAHLAVETGLFNFDSSISYKQWIDSFREAQRPSGQLPGIIPNAGWNYNCGPAWDSALFIIPYNIHLFTGDRKCIEENYDLMRSYLSFCAEMSEDNVVSFGIWDYSTPDFKWENAAPKWITSTGSYYGCVKLFAKFAALLGKEDDRIAYEKLASDIKASFNQKYREGVGASRQGEMTSIATSLYWGLCEESEKEAAVSRLASLAIANGCKADFGILGAKYVPRVLAENGHADLAFRFITQEEYPGWGYWIKKGATTLWEHWKGNSSKNHIMFGDISAWMYQYLAGIEPDPESPGFRHVIIRPHPVSGVEWAKAEHFSPVGRIASAWKLSDNVFALEIEIPADTSATVFMPDSSQHEVGSGNHCFNTAFAVNDLT